jgi:arginase family enzyme
MVGQDSSAEIGGLENDDVGLPTFGSRDWVASADGLLTRHPDVAVVGAPLDIQTTYRPGARFGPRALRSAAYEPGSYHLDLGIDVFEWLDVVDAGDASCPHGQAPRSHRNIEAKVTDVLRAGAFPVVTVATTR